MTGLVPQPRSLVEAEGVLDLAPGGRIAYGDGLGGLASLAAAWIEEALRLRGFKAAFELGAKAEGGRPLVELRLDEALPAEDYRLDIAQGGILVAAGSREGAVWGLSTLRQLLLSEGARLPCLLVEDGPRFAWRGAMLDCARSFFTVEFIERFLDLMALHKLNRFHWHLCDDQGWRLEIKGHPELVAAGSRRRDARHAYPRWLEGSYSAADARRVVAYAAQRGIVVVPEIESPGHALALLASHPELSCASAHARAEGAPGPSFLPEDRFGVFEDILCAGNDAVFGLLGEVYDELASIFPGPWVHAGGDEAPKARWALCPLCGARMEHEGLRDERGAPDPERLQLWFMNRVSGLLAARGKRMIGWDEVLGPGLRGDAIIMSWRGRQGGVAAARQGYDAIMSPQDRACYLDHKQVDEAEEPGNLGVCTLEDCYAFDPIPSELDEAEARHILGAQANLWTEFMYFGRQVEYMAFPRLCALSEVFWSPKTTRDFARFERRMAVHGARLDLLGIHHRIMSRSSFTVQATLARSGMTDVALS